MEFGYEVRKRRGGMWVLHLRKGLRTDGTCMLSGKVLADMMLGCDLRGELVVSH